MNENKICFNIEQYRDKTLNKYINAEITNKYAGSKLKKMGTLYAKRIVEQAMVDGIMFDWPCKLKFDWYLPNGRIDPDNWDFTKKFIFDGMQKAKVQGVVFLGNDSVKNIRGYDHDFYIDKENPRLEIYEMEVKQ